MTSRHQSLCLVFVLLLAVSVSWSSHALSQTDRGTSLVDGSPLAPLPEISMTAKPETEADATTDSTPALGDDPKRIIKALVALTSDQPIDGVTALTILLIGSFVIDRTASTLLWLLSLTPIWSRSFPNPSSIAVNQSRQRSIAEAKLIAVYYAISIMAAFILLTIFCEVQLLGAVGFTTDHPLADRYLTGAMIVLGAQRVAQWFNLPGTPGTEPANAQPILVTGEMVLREPAQTDNSEA